MDDVKPGNATAPKLVPRSAETYRVPRRWNYHRARVALMRAGRPYPVWDNWKQANLDANIIVRAALAKEERDVAQRAAAFAWNVPGASLRSVRATVAEAINRLSRERLANRTPGVVRSQRRRGIA